jgi:hypothetical protein
MVREMSRLLLWITTALLGVAAIFMTSFLGPATFPLLAVAVIVMVKVDRLVALSGLMLGFGGSSLLLLANQLSSGGTLEQATSWVIMGIVPIAIGLLSLVPTAGRSLVGHQQA